VLQGEQQRPGIESEGRSQESALRSPVRLRHRFRKHMGPPPVAGQDDVRSRTRAVVRIAAGFFHFLAEFGGSISVQQPRIETFAIARQVRRSTSGSIDGELSRRGGFASFGSMSALIGESIEDDRHAPFAVLRQRPENRGVGNVANLNLAEYLAAHPLANVDKGCRVLVEKAEALGVQHRRRPGYRLDYRPSVCEESSRSTVAAR